MTKWPVSTQGILAFIYVVVVLVIAYFMPDTSRHLHNTVIRYLGANTRIAGALLKRPKDLSPEEGALLDRENRTLLGQYLTCPVDAGERVTPDNVLPWPDLNGEEAVPVEYAAQPDWRYFNAGAAVEVWVGKNKVADHAGVLAIVPSGKQWLVLLRKSDLPAPLTGQSPDEKPVLRIAALPQKPAAKAANPAPPAKKITSPNRKESAHGTT